MIRRFPMLRAFLPRGAVLISSDLIRASATADILGQGRDRLPHEPMLREFHFGDWDGRHFSDVSVTDPELSRAYWETPGDVCPPGGESWNTAATRVSSVTARLAGDHRGRDIIVVAHFGVILTQLCRAKGQTAVESLAQSIDPLSVTRLDWSGSDWSTGLINHIP